MTILKVYSTGLKKKMTRVDEKLDELLVWDDIRPERIKVFKLSDRCRSVRICGKIILWHSLNTRTFKQSDRGNKTIYS